MPIIPPIAYYLSTWEVEAEELVLNLSMIPPHAKNTPPKDKQKKAIQIILGPYYNLDSDSLGLSWEHNCMSNKLRGNAKGS